MQATTPNIKPGDTAVFERDTETGISQFARLIVEVEPLPDGRTRLGTASAVIVRLSGKPDRIDNIFVGPGGVDCVEEYVRPSGLNYDRFCRLIEFTPAQQAASVPEISVPIGDE